MNSPTSAGLGGCPLRRRGRVARDGEDGAFARVVERLVQAVRSLAERRGHLPCRCGRPVAERFGEAQEEMGEHHAGVAARAEHGRAGHGAGGVRKRGVAERPEGVGDGAERQAEVGAGVTVGDGKDVDPVDLVPPCRHPVRGGEKRSRQPRSVHIGDPDTPSGADYSGTTETRTSAWTSGCRRTCDGMLAEGLDRVLELDPPPVHRVALGRQRVGDVLGGDRAEQLALLAGLARQCERHRAERGGGALGLDPLGLVAGRPGAGFPSDPLLVTLGGLEREPSGQEKVARVAGLDPDHLAGLAERLHVLAQDHFDHRSTPPVVGVVEPTPEI